MNPDDRGTKHAGFNPRPPCGGRPDRRMTARTLLPPFQSAPPVRGATPGGRLGRSHSPGFNPRPPCGGRPDTGEGPAPQSAEFQSAPPVRGATATFGTEDVAHFLSVSIRAPRAGGDPGARSRYRPHEPGFNPRPPCGGRPTTVPLIPPGLVDVSIRAPRAGGDHAVATLRLRQLGFQSAPPVRGATRPPRLRSPPTGLVSIRAPRAGGDPAVHAKHSGCTRRFQSAPPVRGATVADGLCQHRADVSIRAPRAGGDPGRSRCRKP